MSLILEPLRSGHMILIVIIDGAKYMVSASHLIYIYIDVPNITIG